MNDKRKKTKEKKKKRKREKREKKKKNREEEKKKKEKQSEKSTLITYKILVSKLLKKQNNKTHAWCMQHNQNIVDTFVSISVRFSKI